MVEPSTVTHSSSIERVPLQAAKSPPPELESSQTASGPQSPGGGSVDDASLGSESVVVGSGDSTRSLAGAVDRVNSADAGGWLVQPTIRISRAPKTATTRIKG